MPLIDELPADPDIEIADDDARFTPFRNYPSRLHAEIVREALANEGIPSIIKSDEAFGFAEMGTSSTASVTLWVAEDAHELAAQIADRVFDQNL